MTKIEAPVWSDLLMAHRVLTEPAFYCVPARAYEELMDLVEDLELGRIADARLADGQEPLRVSLDAL